MENVKEQDVANGLFVASTRNAQLVERNATGEDQLLVITPDVLANGDNVSKCANREDAVANNVFAMENNVLLKIANAIGQARKFVHQRNLSDVIGNPLVRLVDKDGVAINLRRIVVSEVH